MSSETDDTLMPSAFRYIAGGKEGVWVYAAATLLSLYAVAIGPIGSIRDFWFYKDYQSAITAFREWDTEKDPEPKGWVEHPKSGRRRYPDGDPASEEKWQ